MKSYGWDDIKLAHRFYELEYLPENDRTRFTIAPEARKEILKRLLNINKQIYSSELPTERIKQKQMSKKGKGKANDVSPTLFS